MTKLIRSSVFKTASWTKLSASHTLGKSFALDDQAHMTFLRRGVLAFSAVNAAALEL